MAPPSRKISAIDFDRVLQHVGPLGPWQYCHAFLLFLVSFLLDYNECYNAPSPRSFSACNLCERNTFAKYKHASEIIMPA